MKKVPVEGTKTPEYELRVLRELAHINESFNEVLNREIRIDHLYKQRICSFSIDEKKVFFETGIKGESKDQFWVIASGPMLLTCATDTYGPIEGEPGCTTGFAYDTRNSSRILERIPDANFELYKPLLEKGEKVCEFAGLEIPTYEKSTNPKE